MPVLEESSADAMGASEEAAAADAEAAVAGETIGDHLA